DGVGVSTAWIEAGRLERSIHAAACCEDVVEPDLCVRTGDEHANRHRGRLEPTIKRLLNTRGRRLDRERRRHVDSRPVIRPDGIDAAVTKSGGKAAGTSGKPNRTPVAPGVPITSVASIAAMAAVAAAPAIIDGCGARSHREHQDGGVHMRTSF